MKARAMAKARLQHKNADEVAKFMIKLLTDVVGVVKEPVWTDHVMVALATRSELELDVSGSDEREKILITCEPGEQAKVELENEQHALASNACYAVIYALRGRRNDTKKRMARAVTCAVNIHALKTEGDLGVKDDIVTAKHAEYLKITPKLADQLPRPVIISRDKLAPHSKCR